MHNIFRDNIRLNEADHRYFLVDDPDADFVSCTTFIEYFFKKFDAIGIANKLTSTHPNYMGMPPQELVKTWESSSLIGTQVHKEIDDHIKFGTYPLHSKSKLGVDWFRSLDFDRYEIFSETMIYSKEINIAGTVDLVLRDKETDTIDIYDWKTSKAIEKTSFGGRVGSTPATQTLLDCNFNHYSLQLSLYRYLLENFYGLKVETLTLLHLNSTSVIQYKCPYMKDTIAEMLKYDRAALAKKTEESLTKEYNCDFR